MQIWKCVISCINLWFANVKSEILEGSGRFQIEAGWWKVAETNVRSAHCSAQCGHPPPPTFPPAPPQVWDQPALSYTSQFSSFVSYLLYLWREDRSFLQFHTSSFLQFELSLFFSLDSIRAPPTFQLPIGILCYIVIFLNPLSPNTHQKGNGWIRSVPNMEKLLWRRSEKLMPPVSYLPFWQTDCFQWWSRLKSVVLHSPALLSSTEDPKFPNMADLTNWKRALLLDSINITTAAL